MFWEDSAGLQSGSVGVSWGITAGEFPHCSLQFWAVPCQGSEAEVGQEQA